MSAGLGPSSQAAVSLGLFGWGRDRSPSWLPHVAPESWRWGKEAVGASHGRLLWVENASINEALQEVEMTVFSCGCFEQIPFVELPTGATWEPGAGVLDTRGWREVPLDPGEWGWKGSSQTPRRCAFLMQFDYSRMLGPWAAHISEGSPSFICKRRCNQMRDMLVLVL